MQIINEKKYHRIDFDTFGEFLDYAEAQVPASERGKYDRGSTHSWSASESFFHTKSFSEATDLLRRGWDEGTARLAELRANLDGLLHHAVTRKKANGVGYDVAAGEWLDVGRYLGGEPECFGVTQDGNDTASPVVTVLLNLSASGACNEHEFFARGAIAIGLVDTLESLGHRVEFRVGTSAESAGSDRAGTHEFVVTAKEPDQPLDVDRLAFLCCHPSALRRYGFSVYEKLGRKGGGLPQKIKGYEETLYIGEMKHGADFTAEEFRDEIVALCKQAGVEFGEELLSL
jgi:hypothetical protein